MERRKRSIRLRNKSRMLRRNRKHLEMLLQNVIIKSNLVKIDIKQVEE
jgi:hypothetical protein